MRRCRENKKPASDATTIATVEFGPMEMGFNAHKTTSYDQAERRAGKPLGGMVTSTALVFGRTVTLNTIVMGTPTWELVTSVPSPNSSC